MRYRIPFLIGIGLGAVAGVRYGRPAFDQVQRRIRDLRAREAVTHRSGTGNAAPIRLLNGSSAR
jgi:hypothetical protein